jgi:hypothetical protein
VIRAPAVSPELRRLLATPGEPAIALGPGAHAQAMLFSHVLERLARLFSDAGVPALLVKGAGLARTVYPEPAARPMTDLDLLVRHADGTRAREALLRGGLAPRPPAGRPRSEALFGEELFHARSGAAVTMVELHTTLDKIARRPVDEAGLFARATPAPGLPGLFVPSLEDHVLLVALHAATHDFDHPIAFLDLELCLRRGIDEEALVERARAFCLETVMFVALSMLRDLGAASPTPELVARFEPGPLRRAAAERAVASGRALGLPWILRQTALRDDVAGWSAGVARYAVARVLDRVPSLPSRLPVGQDARVSYRVPLWVRALLAAERAALRLDNAREGLRDELLLAWVRPEDRPALTAALYSEISSYLPGGERYEGGLYPWEKRALSTNHFPTSGRALVGAAGAGREVHALVERGFEVVAYDPCGPFVEAGRAVAPAGRVSWTQATYADLVDAAAGRGGPLASLHGAAPFDLVILGWGSLSHVLPARARVDLLRAVRALAPRAPVLLSFALEPGGLPKRPTKGRVREALRAAFRALGAPGASEVGDHFFASTGFFSYLDAEEVHGLAAETGYVVPIFEEDPYAHAVFVPASGSHAAP